MQAAVVGAFMIVDSFRRHNLRPGLRAGRDGQRQGIFHCWLAPRLQV
jgi:hypothetical protein